LIHLQRTAKKRSPYNSLFYYSRFHNILQAFFAPLFPEIRENQIFCGFFGKLLDKRCET